MRDILLENLKLKLDPQNLIFSLKAKKEEKIIEKVNHKKAKDILENNKFKRDINTYNTKRLLNS